MQLYIQVILHSTCLIHCGIDGTVQLIVNVAQLGMPWFYRKSLVPLSESIEVRICKTESHSDEDTAIEEMEIFVL